MEPDQTVCVGRRVGQTWHWTIPLSLAAKETTYLGRFSRSEAEAHSITSSVREKLMHHVGQLLRGVLPQRRTFNLSRVLPVVVLSGALAAGALILTPTSSEGSTRDHNRLFAYVVPTTRGPLHACSDPDNCTPATVVREFIYVVNGNQLTNEQGGTRETLPNAYVVSSVDEAIFVDGVHTFDEAFTPPPNAIYRSRSGNWPSTVTCPPGPNDPCNVVNSPAIDPGEDTIIVRNAWAHGVEEPNGTYVFRFTVHGTLNGTPVDLTASSPPILMTN